MNEVLGYKVVKSVPKSTPTILQPKTTSTPVATAEKDYVAIFQNVTAGQRLPEEAGTMDWKKYALWGGIGAALIGAIYWLKKK